MCQSQKIGLQMIAKGSKIDEFVSDLDEAKELFYVVFRHQVAWEGIVASLILRPQVWVELLENHAYNGCWWLLLSSVTNKTLLQGAPIYCIDLNLSKTGMIAGFVWDHVL